MFLLSRDKGNNEKLIRNVYFASLHCVCVFFSAFFCPGLLWMWWTPLKGCYNLLDAVDDAIRLISLLTFFHVIRFPWQILILIFISHSLLLNKRYGRLAIAFASLSLAAEAAKPNNSADCCVLCTRSKEKLNKF